MFEVGEGFDKYSTLLKRYWLPITLGSLGLIFFVYGLIALLGSASKQDNIVFESSDLASKSASLISVDIEGAVIKPGVYKLASDSIIQDALVSSQGLAEDADRDFVSKNINLAAKLYDGAKIYIPKLNEGLSETGDTAGQTSNSASKDSLININTASSDNLDTLPGIGPVTAGKIINSRPYLSITELLDKKIVSGKVFDQIKDKITAY